MRDAPGVVSVGFLCDAWVLARIGSMRGIGVGVSMLLGAGISV